MDIQAAESAMRRANKRLAHAVRQRAEATSERARKRHERRAANARRNMRDAVWTFEHLAMVEA